MGIANQILKSILIITAINLLILSMANAETQKMQMSQDLESQLFIQDMNQMVDSVNQMMLMNDTSYNVSTQSVSDSCQQFMSKDYDFGTLGQLVFTTLDKNSSELYRLLDGGELNSLCPNYKDKSTEEKARVWAMVLTLMSHFESSCNAKVPAKGPNGKLYGLFQLHKYQEAFYDGSSNLCVKNASLSPQKSVVCTLSMLNMQFEKQDMMLFAPGSYWDVLRLKSKTKKAILIKKAIKNSNLCKAAI